MKVPVFYTGKLKVESKPQVKVDNLEDLALSEVEQRLYDRYNITISDVKVLLADSGLTVMFIFYIFYTCVFCFVL